MLTHVMRFACSQSLLLPDSPPIRGSTNARACDCLDEPIKFEVHLELHISESNVMRVGTAHGRRLPSGLCHESARLSLAFLVNFYDSPISSSSSSVFPSFSGKGRIASERPRRPGNGPSRAQTWGLGSPFAKMCSKLRDLPKRTRRTCRKRIVRTSIKRRCREWLKKHPLEYSLPFRFRTD